MVELSHLVSYVDIILLLIQTIWLTGCEISYKIYDRLKQILESWKSHGYFIYFIYKTRPLKDVEIEILLENHGKVLEFQICTVFLKEACKTIILLYWFAGFASVCLSITNF